ncbi:MAG: alpha-amylase family glycosyl hydrolase [Chitinophagaceae bacterium]
MIRKNYRLFCLLPALALLLWTDVQAQPAREANEVIYHVFLRSFYDADGDAQGDLEGLRQKLGYLQELGITAILLTPINSSPYYHNYFSDDFEKIDPEFGSLDDYTRLAREVHRREMKLYLDMETQYVTEDHAWWKDSYHNPASPYSDYIIYNDRGNTQPESIIFNLTGLTGYNGVTRRITTVNLLSPKVLDYNDKLFRYWMDPNGDGKFDDGADGFRLDHAMDDLDWKGKFTGLFEKFWHPLLTRLRQVNPRLVIIAEQADWSDFGQAYFEKAGVDRVFAFRLQQAILSFDKTKLQQALDSTLLATPAGRRQVVFLENHDMPRFASATGRDDGKLRAGAALSLLLPGIPLIYYGQELGMYGSGGFGKFGNTDANDIPMREAFEWYRSDSGRGMAVWYRNTGPWWDNTNLVANDGISLEEQEKYPASLYRYYKTLLHLRHMHPALYAGQYRAVPNDGAQVFSFLRFTPNQTLLILVNLAGDDGQLAINAAKAGLGGSPTLSPVYPAGNAPATALHFSLRPYEVQVWSVKQ